MSIAPPRRAAIAEATELSPAAPPAGAALIVAPVATEAMAAHLTGIEAAVTTITRAPATSAGGGDAPREGACS